MKRSLPWKAALFFLASLSSGPAALAGSQEVELRMTLQVHGGGAEPASPKEVARTAEVLHSRLDQAGAGGPRVEVNGVRISVRAITEDPERLRPLLLPGPEAGAPFRPLPRRRQVSAVPRG